MPDRQSRIRFAALAALAVGLAAACRQAPPPSPLPVMRDASLRVERVAGGFKTPTSMAFVGPDELLVLEKSKGRVRHVRDGHVVGTALDLAVNSSSESGLLGIALHPDFRRNGFVYLYGTWKGRGSGPGDLGGDDTGKPREAPVLGTRVDRFVWKDGSLIFDRNVARLPFRWILDTLGVEMTNHRGGVLAFGPDGKLYAAVGDQNLRGQLQNVAGGPGPTDENLTGVVLRLNDDGSTPPDNPFHGLGARVGGEIGRNLQRIFAYGVRNSFGMAFDPRTGTLWMTENGDDALDEVQPVPAGLNSRWIQIMGPESRYAAYRSIELASREGLDNRSLPPASLAASPALAEGRLVALPGSVTPEPALSWKNPQGLTAIAFGSGAGLGSVYDGDLFVGDTNTGCLFRLPLVPDRRGLALVDPRLADGVVDNRAKGDLTESESLVAGKGFGILTDLETGPDGALYALSMTAGAVYRISRR